MKSIVHIVSLLLCGCFLSTCFKESIDPIKICFRDIALDLPNRRLASTVDQLQLRGQGLQYFNPDYGDSILVDDIKIPDNSLEYRYNASDAIDVTIPGRAGKKLGVGTLELRVSFPKGSEDYHCGNLNYREQFCFETPLRLEPPVARAGDEIKIRGQFHAEAPYRVFFYGAARVEAGIVGVSDGETSLRVRVPARPWSAGPQLEQAIQMAILNDQDQEICRVEGPKFTYEYTYTATLIGGILGLQGCAAPCDGFCFPRGIDLDRAGNLYVANSFSQTIRLIPFDQMTDTYGASLPFAGGCRMTEAPLCSTGMMNHPSDLSFARFSSPNYLAVDRHPSGGGDIYISENTSGSGKHWLIRQIRGSSITTFAGTCNQDDQILDLHDLPRHRLQVSFPNPQGLAVDSLGNVYVADGNVASGSIYRIDVNTDQVEYLAHIPFPKGIHLEQSPDASSLYVASSTTNAIYRIDLTHGNTVTQLSGAFNKPADITFDGHGNLYVASENNTIGRIDASGDFHILTVNKAAGGGTAEIVQPQGITYDRTLNRLLVASTGNHLIWQIDIQ